MFSIDRSILDTNVLVSSLIRRGKPRLLWGKVLDGKVRLLIFEDILSKFDEVTRRPKLKKYIGLGRLKRFTKVLIRRAEIVDVRTRVPQLTEDPNDTMIVEAAVNGEADYIVSGDKHLLSLMEFGGIKIVAVDQMLKLLGGPRK